MRCIRSCICFLLFCYVCYFCLPIVLCFAQEQLLAGSDPAVDSSSMIKPDAKPQEISAAVTVSKDRVIVGETVDVVITVSWDVQGHQITLMPSQIVMPGMKSDNVASRSENQVSNGVLTKVQTYTYSFKAEDPGKQVTEPIVINYSEDTVQLPRVIQLPPVSVTVVSQNFDLTSKPVFFFSVIGAISVMSIAGIVFLVLLFTGKSATVTVSVDESIRERLADLRALFDADEFNDIIMRLDEIAREYLKGKYSVGIQANISPDSLNDMPELAVLDAADRKMLYRIFHKAFEIRYGNIRCERHDARLVYDEFCSFIEKSMRNS